MGQKTKDLQLYPYKIQLTQGSAKWSISSPGVEDRTQGVDKFMVLEGGRLRIYMVEAGFSHANAVLTKQRNRRNLENRGDLRLELTYFKPNINSLAAADQAHPSH
ncbi:hypothetical protein FHG87_013623 [Trinorchestia longiramus]|nr:hypothetical protein FHG87_013623 [Trinorchestia longiramus]